MTAAYFLCIPTVTGVFLPIFHVERKSNPSEMAWRSSVLIAFATAQQMCCLVWPLDQPSSPLHREPSQPMGIAWPHSCTGCKARQVHLHTITTDGRIPFQLHFRSRGKKSRGAYYCGWDKFSWNGRGDGKGSPLTLIWANDTVPASYNNTPRKNSFQMTELPCLSHTEDSELIKIINCTCHICHLFNLYLMRWNTCRGVFVRLG